MAPPLLVHCQIRLNKQSNPTRVIHFRKLTLLWPTENYSTAMVIIISVLPAQHLGLFLHPLVLLPAGLKYGVSILCKHRLTPLPSFRALQPHITTQGTIVGNNNPPQAPLTLIFRSHLSPSVCAKKSATAGSQPGSPSFA